MDVPNQQDIERKWQKVWKDGKVFEPKVDASKEKFFGTNAYPYANSSLHIGHGRTFITTDILFRHQRVLGKNVFYPMGFHITGTPVLAVADSIARGDEKQLKMSTEAVREYVKDEKKVSEIVRGFTDPKNIASFFSSKIEETFDAIGLSVDWSKQFTTGDPGYQRFISWQFRKLEEVGVLTQGKYPILYSYLDENAVGEDDIKDGDTDKVAVQEMTYILFELVDEKDTFVAVATLRPDALFGTTNLWLNPELTLTRVRVGKQTWIVTKEAVVKLTHQFDDVEVLQNFSSKELLDKKAIVPLMNYEVPFAQAKFIDPFHGSGMVYASPAGSPHDYLGLAEAKAAGVIDTGVAVINIVTTKDKKGNVIAYDGECPAHAIIKKYGITKSDDPKLETIKQELYKEEHYGGVLNENCGEWAGIPIKHAKEKIQQALAERSLGGILYEPSRRAVTRAGHPVIVANLQGQWFLDYSADTTKKKAYELFDHLHYLPENMSHAQKGYLEWVQKRPCARKRGIGTPLPQDPDWVIEALSDSTIYQLYYVVAGYINSGVIKPEELTDDVFNYIFTNGPEPTNTTIAKKVYTQLREDVAYWKSFDLRYTNPPHMSNHLSFLIYHYALIIPKELWPISIAVGGLLIRDGQKISKSKGNGLPLIKVGDEFGVDLCRLYMAVGTSYDSEFDFRDEDIMQLKKKFERWKELCFVAKEQSLPSYESFTDLDRWLVSRFYRRVAEHFDAMKELKIREAYIAILYEFLNELQYHMRRTSEEVTTKVLRFILEDYITLMTPVVPHVCEELYDGVGTGLASFSVYTTDTQNYLVEEGNEGITQELLSSVIRTKERKNMSKLQKVTIIQAPNSKFALFDALKETLDHTRDFKVILPKLKERFADDMKFITKFVPKTLGDGLHYYSDKATEKTYLDSVSSFLEKEFGCSVEIVDGDSFETNTTPLPGRPSIQIE